MKRRYGVLKTQKEAYAELFALIQTRPDNESLEILRRIKMGADGESVLRHVRDGDLFVQLSVEPETRLRYNLPYVDSIPASLLVPDDQYLTTPLYEVTFEPPISAPDCMPSSLLHVTEYYMTLHSLFQGQVTAQRSKPEHSQLFHSKTALEIQTEAYIRFETVMRVRYLRHSFDAYDAWGLLFLIYLGNLAIDLLSNDDSTVAKFTTAEVIRSPAVLCINGLVSQSHSMYTGTLLSCSLIEQLKLVDKARLGRYIFPGIGQVDHPFDSEWPMPNIKVERDEEATMNHISSISKHARARVIDRTEVSRAGFCAVVMNADSRNSD
ncbi:hypothetical protein E8E11_008181 [Didymella keratinophila]|nr:hypothetical protein E8E11_008181 [Didymella keratinophila]